MLRLLPNILSSFSQEASCQPSDELEGNVGPTQMGSPEQFYDAVSSLLPSSDAAKLMDTSFNPESECVFGYGLNQLSHNTSDLSRMPSTIATPTSSDPNVLETDQDIRYLPNHEAQLPIAPPTQDNLRDISQPGAPGPTTNKVDAMSFSTLEYPRSQYKGYVPPLPICREQVAVQELRQAIAQQQKCPTEGSTDGRTANSSDDDDYIEFDLTDFAIYLPQNLYHAYELRGLQDFASKPGHSCMLFDGILSAGSQRRYVQAVPFEICSIGNYGKEKHAVGGAIWIKSVLNKKSDVFYRLEAPSPEYKRFHHDFLWLADLAKHFVDYCDACEEEQRPVSIRNFRKEFSQWVRNAHEASAEFQSWYDKYGDRDFRRAISFNVSFLFKESIGVKGDGLRKQPIWTEVLEKDCIPSQEVKEEQTIVTPYVYDCFKHLRFGHHLKSVKPTKAAHDRQAYQGNALHLTTDVAPSRLVVEIPVLSNLKIGNGPSKSASRVAVEIPAAGDPLIERRKKIKAIKPGDVLSVTKDGEGSVWRDEVSLWKAADDCWYVYVQDVHQSDKGERSFDAIWLYKPSDTSCAKMKYPFPNELFLSDNCSCKERRIEEDEVVDVVTVVWHDQPSECSQIFFIRQTYLENDRFVTLKDAHKTCEHLRGRGEPASFKSGHKYAVGQTVLVAQTALAAPRRKSKYGLDPFEIVKYDTTNSKQYAVLRRLLRRNEIDKQGSCRPNELVYSDEMVNVESNKIERTCLVRFYSDVDIMNQTIPAPYNRDGTGNAFYITSRLTGIDGRKKLTPITAKIPSSLIQGFDPLQVPSRKKLRGLDLYCGGGNFGRGLEEGGALRNEWAVDMDKNAIHTYFANLHESHDTKLYYGSVNDQLYQAMQGNVKRSNLIPRPGEVDFISAGSPCQGFTKLNLNSKDEKGLKNQSLVASVAAYVDFYRPKYGLLENVLNMAQKRRGRDQDVLSQLICAIVGMGYQLSTFMLDAWSCGSSQSRSRIFVAFTAPGYEPIPHPELSHSHPHHVLDRGLGQLANGKAFGERKRDPTPFKFMTAGEAVGDLSFIGDGRTYSCIPHPDHVMPSAVMKELKLQIQAIPIFPRRMSFWKAWNDGKGVMTKEQRALFPSPINTVGKPRASLMKGSKAWGRVDPMGLFSTVVRAAHVKDQRMGRLIHWDQHRSLTVMEARRAQSFPDHEVILGNPAAQVKIIGNSVDRSVSLSLGLSLREAWAKNPLDDGIYGSTNVAEDASVRPIKPQNVLVRDRHGQFSRKSPRNSSFSTTSASENSSPNNEPELAAGSNEALPSIESSPLVRDSHGRFARKNPDKTAQSTRMRSAQKAKPIGIPSNRVIRDSYDSSGDEDFSEQNCRSPVSALALQPPLSPRQAKVLRSIEKLSSHSRPDSQTTSLKRQHAATETTILPPEKTHKAAKLSAAASPASSKLVELNATTAAAKETNPLQRSRSRPINATHLSQKLQVVLTQRITDELDDFAVAADNESEESDFSGFSTSDDGEDDGEDDVGQENKPISQPTFTSPLHHRVISTSSQGEGKSPTKARPVNQFYIDLFSVDDTEQRPRARPAKAKLPMRPTPQTPRRYVPVDNSKFAAYAQTYVVKNYDQTRKHGPRDK